METLTSKDSKYVHEYGMFVITLIKEQRHKKYFAQIFWDYTDFNMFLMSYTPVSLLSNLKVTCVSL